MNGGQDTGGGFGSFGTSNQGFSGNLNLQGGGLNSSTQSFAQQPITSGGDIILTPSGGKKKRWPIVVIVFLVLAIVGVGVGFVFLTPSNNPKGEQANNDNNYVEKFNIYANYLLYGEKENKEVGDFDARDSFVVDKKCRDEEYMKELLALYDDFYNALSSEDVEFALDVSFSFIRDRIEFLIGYNKLEMIDLDMLYEKYTNSGRDDAISYVEGFYEVSDEENSSIEAVKEFDARRALLEIDSWDTGSISDETEDLNRILNNVIYVSTWTIKSQSSEINSYIRSNKNVN